METLKIENEALRNGNNHLLRVIENYELKLHMLSIHLDMMLEASERKIEDGTIQPDLIIALEEEVTRLREYRVMLWALAPHLNAMLEASQAEEIQPGLMNATQRVIAVWRVIKEEGWKSDLI